MDGRTRKQSGESSSSGYGPVWLLGGISLLVLVGIWWSQQDVENSTISIIVRPDHDFVRQYSCEHTVQGKSYVVDSRGYVCGWKGLASNGCCSTTSDTQRFSCEFCNSTVECCVEYEYCVSCCMSPLNRGTATETMKNLPTTSAYIIGIDNIYDFCKEKCRTSSSSIIDRGFRSEHKYCYGSSVPTKETDYSLRIQDDLRGSDVARNLVYGGKDPVVGDTLADIAMLYKWEEDTFLTGGQVESVEFREAPDSLLKQEHRSSRGTSHPPQDCSTLVQPEGKFYSAGQKVPDSNCHKREEMAAEYLVVEGLDFHAEYTPDVVPSTASTTPLLTGLLIISLAISFNLWEKL